MRPLVLAAALLTSTGAHAYTLDGWGFTPPVHEAMTMLAEACLAAHPEPADRLHCGSGSPAHDDLRRRWRKSRHELRAELRKRRRQRRAELRDQGIRVSRRGLRDQVGSRRFSSLALYSRWSDNPEYQSLPGVGWTIAVSCAGHRRKQRPAATGEVRLTCLSHVYDLQFLHAMASVPRVKGLPVAPGSDDSPPAVVELTEASRAKVRGWAAFSFDVATGAVAGSDPLCASLHRSAPGSGVRQAVQDGLGCEGRSVSALFHHGLDGDKPSLQRVARGALLHLVQDGYSDSHAGRQSEPPAAFEPVARCARARAFYEYGDGHLQEQHAKADTWPQLQGCEQSEVADVITASAAVLRLVEQGDRDAFIDYIDARFLGLDEPGSP